MLAWLRNLIRKRNEPTEFGARLDEWVAAWFRTAAGTGFPKGLTWEAFEVVGEPLFVRDRRGKCVALVPVVVRFEPVPGGAMEDVPQAREPRTVVAVFTYTGRAWTTDGRAVFNLTPQQVAERMSGEPRPRGSG